MGKKFKKTLEIRPLLESLPLVRVIGKDAGLLRFHVTHAELQSARNAGNSFTNLDLSKEASLLWNHEHHIEGFGEQGDWRDHALWGRSLIKDAQRRAHENESSPPEQNPFLSTTYAGHTIMPPIFGQNQNMPLRIQSHVFLDSGAFKAAKDGQVGDHRFGLTLWCHKENRGWLMGGDGAVRDLQEDY